MGQPVVHFEVAGKDGKRLREFYTGLFGWKIEVDPAMNYGMVETGGEGGINGGIMQTHGDMPAYVIFYVQVDDLQAYLDKAQGLGATMVMPPTPIPTPIPGVGAFAMIQDPEGNMVGLFKGEG